MYDKMYLFYLAFSSKKVRQIIVLYTIISTKCRSTYLITDDAGPREGDDDSAELVADLASTLK
jgi:hypothetical protein